MELKVAHSNPKEAAKRAREAEMREASAGVYRVLREAQPGEVHGQTLAELAGLSYGDMLACVEWMRARGVKVRALDPVSGGTLFALGDAPPLRSGTK